MSILERPASPEAPAAEESPPSNRLRVITAGDVGNMDARLMANGFDVVAVAETEDQLVNAVSAGEPDAVVVEADLCDSLEHVRDLAPDAVLIVVGDHTPSGALGRIEPGVSGTVMAGLLHALVADGVGAAAMLGLVPVLGQGAAVQVPQSVVGSLLTTKADLLWTYLANAVNVLRDHAELVTAAGTLAVTVSAGVVLTMDAARTDAGPARTPASIAVERVQNEPAPRVPVSALSPRTLISTLGSSEYESEPRDWVSDRGDSVDHDRHDGLDENENNNNQVVNEGSDDQIVNESGDDPIVTGGNEDPHGQNEVPHGRNEDQGDQGRNEDQGEGKNEDQGDQGKNEDQGDQGKNQGRGTDEGGVPGGSEGKVERSR